MEQPVKRIDQLMREAVRHAGDSPFLLIPAGLTLDDGQTTDRLTTLGYAQVYEHAKRVAGVLRAAGVAPGDRVACVMGNSAELVYFMLACGLCDAIAVTLNTLSTPTELRRILADCEPSAVFFHANFAALIDEDVLPQGLKLQVVVGQAPAAHWTPLKELLAQAQPWEASQEDLRSDAAAIMIYSSGTTGMPKGIVLSHQGVVDNALAASQVLGYGPTDRLLTILPMFSSFGFAFDFLHVLLNRASVVIMPRFDEATAVQLVEDHRVTFLAGVPTMFSRIFDPDNLQGHDISSLRMIDVGGGPVSLRLKAMLMDEVGVTVIESYGLTEISPVATAQRPNDNLRGSSCGAPLPGMQVKVVDSAGKTLGADEPGELLFKSETFMIGYWRQPEQTAQAIRDGWLHTGDVGYLDQAGHVHIMDRTKDVIVANGFNVYPKEVENSIAEFAGVQAVAVVGIADEIRGETIHAFVVPRTAVQLDTEAIRAHCAKHLSRYKVPRSVTVISEMPLTASGKVQRFRLREMLTSGNATPAT